ncbi:Phosphatidylserine decarboxylase [Rickettsiales endosymbiont of Paramecium tredecaurelia]|uniref:phosphatidylserine decarboxylase n=1 Tax=Candidatus Sarmatiella mevalonica TaxID=2770581 RepID=UPI001920656D|nr:phosphatidylserine decarboxylase [Candidatus Sarmatiella mevalonica]MBL3285113.1 Phosphatidylserine decarboxylase [Candidatus Sarmatiella mevalonica]
MKQYSDLSRAIHREGYIFILLSAVTTFLLGVSSGVFAWVGCIVTCWCIYFFRNPDRITPLSDDVVVGIGDGIVTAVAKVSAPTELQLDDQEMMRVSVFLSIFDVHVNRVPANGVITALHYVPGKFLNASLDKSSIHNERQLVAMKMNNGRVLAFAQIAGLIARRIVCDLEENAQVQIGARYGIIRFGSRVDLYLPADAMIMVSPGQRCIGGETVIARFEEKYQEQQFAKR